MRKFSLLIVSLLFLFTACSPEIVQTLPSEDIKPNSSYLEVSPSESGTGLTLEFNLVPYANNYGYSINNGNIENISQMTYSEGRYTADVEVETGLVDGIVSVYADISNKGNWVLVAEKDFVLSLENVLPKAYISRRSADFVAINVDTSLASGSVIYKVTVGEDEAQLFFSNEFEVPVTSEVCSIEISQALIGDENYSPAQTIDVPAYDSALDSTLKFSIEDEYIVVHNALGYDSVSICKFENIENGTDPITVIHGLEVGSDGIARYKISDLDSLESGYFFAQAEVSGEKRISNVEKFTVPLRVEKTSVNWQSVEFEIPFASDISTDVTFELKGVIGATATRKANTNTVIVSGLASNTKYEQLKLVASSDSFSSSYTFNVKTKSFEGVYEWKGFYDEDLVTEHNFKVIVEQSPSGSSVGYYVFFHDKDEAIAGSSNEGKKLRIMPLVDPAFEKELMQPSYVSVDNPGEYEKQNAGYEVNGKKWNSMSMYPKGWTIAKWEPEHDSATTVTWAGVFSSKPSSSFSTTTSFTFKEQEIGEKLSPTLLFYNKGEGLVSLGLIKNGDPDSEIGENTNTFCLQKVSE